MALRDTGLVMRKGIGASLFFALLTLASRGALAQDEKPVEHFGDGGQWVFTFQTFGQGGGFAFVHRKTDGDFFAARNFSLGLALGWDYDSLDSGLTLFDVGARLGFNVNFAQSVGLWPTAGVFYYHLTGNGMPTGKDLHLEVLVPIVFHPAPHFLLGAGPSLLLGLNGQGSGYGLDFVLGGWI
jgi:hypothetical protein